MVDGYALSHYRKGVNVRAKTDAIDAQLLARYLKNEGQDLTPWAPPPAIYRQLLSLFRRRAGLVQARTSLTQGWANEPLLKAAFKTHLRAMRRLLVEKMIKGLLEKAGLMPQVKRCMKVEGVGFLTAARLTATFQRGNFSGVMRLSPFGYGSEDCAVGAEKGQSSSRSEETPKLDASFTTRLCQHPAQQHGSRTTKSAWRVVLARQHRLSCSHANWRE